MLVRQATLADKNEILKITDLLHLDIPNFVWNNEDFVKAQIEKGEYFLASDNNATAGIMSLRQGKNRMYIETLAVKKEYQSNGIGSQFIEFAKNYARERGFDSLHTYSFCAYNMADFYLKKGFSKISRLGYYSHHPYYCFEIKV